MHDGVRYECDQCGFQAIRKHGLINHIETEHGGVRYDCTMCTHQAKRMDNLRRHEKHKHAKNSRNKLRIYICNLCDHQSPRKDNLAVHRSSKHAEEQYPCDQCALLALSNGSLKFHIETKHADVNLIPI